MSEAGITGEEKKITKKKKLKRKKGNKRSIVSSKKLQSILGNLEGHRHLLGCVHYQGPHACL